MSHTPDFVTRAEMARRAGCTAANVSRVCNHGPLKEAVVGRRLDANHPAAVAWLAERTDPPPSDTQNQDDSAAQKDHRGVPWHSDFHDQSMRQTTKGAWRKKYGVPREAVDAYERQFIQPKANGWRAKREQDKAQAPMTGDDFGEIPENIAAFADMPLRELIHRFGTDVRFLDWLKALKTIEEVDERRIKNAQSKRQLIPRDMVVHHVLGAIEDANVRLLNDSPRTIAAEIVDAVHAGESTEEIESRVRSAIQNQIRAVKARAQRGIRNAER